MRLELLFKERIVGRMKVGPRRVLDLTGAGVQDLDALSDGGESDGAGSVVGNVTNSDLAAPIFNASAAVSLPPDISVDFEPITGARHVNRNDVFMAFCTYSQSSSFLSVEPDDEVLRPVSKTFALQKRSKARRNPLKNQD